MASWLRGRLLPGDRALFWNSRLHANAATPIATTKKVTLLRRSSSIYRTYLSEYRHYTKILRE